MLYALGQIPSDVQADGSATMLLKRLEVAHCLGAYERAEGVGRAWDRQVAPGVGCDLDEHTFIWAAFVQFACRMQESRVVAEGGCNVSSVSYSAVLILIQVF